jgi:hypothetical protein
MNNSNDFYIAENIPPIDENHIVALVENPPVLCGSIDCPKDVNDRYCKCITTVFQHETHYLLYLKLIKQKIESAFVELLKTEN